MTFVHCLPLNKFLLDVSKCDVPSFREFFLAPPPLKKHNEDANASFVNWKKLTPLSWEAFSRHWSINLGTWQRRESFCSTRDVRCQKKFDSQTKYTYRQFSHNVEMSQWKQLNPYHVNHKWCFDLLHTLQSKNGKGISAL